ncbi:MAG: ABC transporter permease, partial [Caldilineaceae bacterium]|nr:ABC transporter permease [Caldilineaceae bacterium]
MRLPWNLAKIGHVITFEYSKLVFTRRFLLSMLTLPFIIGLIAVVGIFVARMETNTAPIGYVDRGQILSQVSPDRLPPVAADDAVALIAYADETAAQAALDRGEIQGYYVVAEDYATTGRVRLVYADRAPTGVAQRTFRDFLQANLVRDLPVEVARRLTAGADFVLPKADGGRQPMDFSLFINAFMPAILGFGFILTIFTTSGYLMQAVVEEKENRTMEVL